MHRRILLFRDYYLPGYKSGGPIQTIANLVENLGDEFAFYIVTRDRDAGDKQPFPSIKVDDWNPVGKGQVFYASPGRDFALRLIKLWRELDPDLVYLNSFFSPNFTILPLLLRRARLVPKSPTIVGPRGELHDGALALKSAKKSIYRRASQLTGLYNEVYWCASNEDEAEFIRRRIRPDVSIRIAPDLGALKPPSRNPHTRQKTEGSARFAVVARVAPIKNLHRSIQWLSRLDGDVVFDIYGPIADTNYWETCKAAIAEAPPNVRITYKGALPHPKVHDKLGEYDFFLMPSASENHGHSIIEAMVAGCPPIISTGTPWRNLEAQNAGWDLPLADDLAFVSALQRCVDMGPDEYALLSQGAHAFGARNVCPEEAVEQNRALFLV